jgi:NADH-quinone oxidoreductase subunit H
MVSYEAALGLSLAAVILVSGTLSTSGIVDAQSSIGKWSVVATGFLPFATFLIAATAELNRPPFDLVEAEQELVAGFNTEYASIRFALFYLAEFMNTITMSGVIVTLFFGGPQPVSVNGWTLTLPFGPLTGTVWFVLKLMVFLYIYVWFRATLPRLRYDQLMNLGWKLLIPIALAWFMALAALKVAQDADWSGARQWLAGGIAAAVILLGYLLLTRAMRLAAKVRGSEGAMF